jgi:hypothetical protein
MEDRFPSYLHSKNGKYSNDDACGKYGVQCLYAFELDVCAQESY